MLLLLVTSTLFATNSFASTDPPIIQKLDGKDGQLKVDSFRTVRNTKFFDAGLAANIDTPFSVKNIVTFKLNEASQLFLNKKFTATVSLKIIYNKTTNAGDTSSIIKDFIINYDSAATYKNRDVFVFKGAQEVTVQVINISVLSSTGADITTAMSPALVVENEMLVGANYKFDCSTKVLSSLSSSIPEGITNPDELAVSWASILGADEYDIEWSYLDSSALSTYDLSDIAKRDFIFKNNATRVTITGLSYAIPLMYDNSGRLYFRVRAINYSATGKRIEANWSSVNSSGLGEYGFHGHERGLNWQATTSYAEEGKRKVVVQYYDGSLRSRQTVTKDNTTNTVVVAESFYDYQGRPVIQVLPAPTLNTIIKYTASFNTGLNGSEYEKFNYDSLASPSAYCGAGAGAMNTATGASNYYSTSNSQVFVGFNQFIPNANKFPFTETEYTQDGTGRISRQSGVGDKHKLGSDHETKYAYGTPDQNELDALFGTEVGDRSHYFKNMVRDANGQFSISYVDMHGRTIATALAGTPSTVDSIPLDKLASNTSATITENLIDSNNAIIKDLLIENKKSLLVSTAGSYEFNYQLNPESLVKDGCTQSSICYDCLYDLRITISDDCNNGKLPNGRAFDTTIRNFSLNAIDTTCTAAAGFSFNFTLSLVPGNYEITKELSVSRYAMDYYRDSVFMKKNTCKTLQQIVNEQRTALYNNLQCTPNCQACTDSIGTWDNFRTKFMEKAGIAIADTASNRGLAFAAYNDALESCAVLCNTTNEGDDIRRAMLLDVTAPTGQYAGQLNDEYSIFYKTADSLAAYQRNTVVYYDAQGNIDYVTDEHTGQLVKPNFLDSTQFVNKFKPSWANALLKFHPEYCKLIGYESHNASHSWDRLFEATHTYRDAWNAGYLNPTANTSTTPFNRFHAVLANKDPFASESTTYQNRLEDSLAQYRRITINHTIVWANMWSLSTILARSLGNNDTTGYVHSYYNPFDTTTMCDGDLDMAWRYFRGMYLQSKKSIVYDWINSDCSEAPLVNDLLAAGHQLNFNNAQDAIKQNGYGYLLNTTTGTAAQNAADTSKASFYDANCKAYTQAWAQQLGSCYDSTALAWIVPRLIDVCKKGSNLNHPYGSSDISPDSTNMYNSFDAVIVAYNAAHGITDVYCDATLITAPKPYNSQAIYSTKPVWTKPADCECDKINSLYEEYGNNTDTTSTTFSIYLFQTRHTSMSNADLYTLMGLCATGGGHGGSGATCNFLATPISLPPALQCYSGDVCVTCNTVDTLYRSFRLKYPTVIPTREDTDSVQVLKNNLFVNYMNSKLGYSKQAWQYLDFMQACKIATDSFPAITNIPTCTLMDSLLTDFYCYSSSLEDSVANTGQCGQTYWQVQASNGFGPSYDHYTSTNVNDFVSGGSLLFPSPATGYFAGGIHYTLQRPICINNAFTAEFRIKNPIYNPDSLHVDGGGDVGFSFEGDAINTNGAMYLDKIYFDFTPGLPGAGFYDYRDVRYYDTVMDRPSRNFEDFRIVKLICTPANYQIFYNGQLLKTVPRDGNSYITNIAEINWAAWGMQNRQIDWVKLYNSNNELVYTENFDDAAHMSKPLAASLCPKPDCKTTFVNYFNTRLGTTYSFDEIAYLYKQSCGKLLSSCLCSTNGSKETVDTCSISDFVVTYNRLDTTGCGNGFANFHIAIKRDKVFCSPTQSVSVALSQYTTLTNELVSTTYVNVPADPGYLDTCLSIVGKDDIIFACGLTGCNNSTGSSFGNNGCNLLLCGKSEPLLPPVSTNDITNCSDSSFFIISKATELYNYYRDSLKNVFDNEYRNKCLNAYKYESFTVKHVVSEYHYTLYYYDQAGNLLKTVPPAGVKPNRDSTWLVGVKTARANGTTQVPAHNMVTQYRYNTLNQVVKQKTPDAGTSKFWYDRLGRLTISQNAKQAPNNQYSYTLYDDIGRITEVGQLVSTDTMSVAISRKASSLATWIGNVASTKAEITKTVYDTAYPPLSYVLNAQNLRNRVAYTVTYKAKADMDTSGHETGSFYSYDIHGNVDTLLQDYKLGNMAAHSNRFKKLVYQYDLISGKVNHVAYQANKPDAFYHRYLYDAENRLTDVETSYDSIYWEKEAYYQYYKHGPLARTVIGQQQVQGIDYAYTIQGWLKGVNTTIFPDDSGNPGLDMGQDGLMGVVVSSKVATDAYGFGLYYYTGDYYPVNDLAGLGLGIFGEVSGLNSLYNGNITAMGTYITKFANQPFLLNMYKYDQLNRLVAVQPNTMLFYGSPIDDFKENISYDANGNIRTYKRNGNNSFTGNQLAMDDMSYRYYYINTSGIKRPYDPTATLPGDFSEPTNQLAGVKDAVDANNYISDIDNQADSNYTYDAIGNLITDAAEGITNISWTVYGKIQSISKTRNGVSSTITYSYDAAGHRIRKNVVTGSIDKTIWYVRDASGNTMSTYEYGNDSLNNGKLTQTEIHLYGSSRLGMYRPNKDVQTYAPDSLVLMPNLGTATVFSFVRGKKLFELSNHLGNVLVTVSDKKVQVDYDNDGTVDYYNADIQTAQDYYAFGMVMPGRQFPAVKISRQVAGGGTSATPVQVYRQRFEGTPYSHPYTAAPDVLLSSYLSNGSWTNTQGSFTNYAVPGGNAIALASATPTTSKLQLVLTVATGYNLSIRNFSFNHGSTSGGYTNWSLSINGTVVGSGSVFVNSYGLVTSTGTPTVLNPVNNLTGTVTVELTLSGGSHGSTDIFMLDNFSLNGYVLEDAPSGGGGSGIGSSDKDWYRYGFNGKEDDKDISEGGQDYGMRIYDARLGRFLSVDPLSKKYPFYTPYQFAGNDVIRHIDLDGKEPFLPQKLMAAKLIQINKQLSKQVTVIKSLKCHPDGQILADKINYEIAKEYAKLDFVHGQIDFPRNKVVNFFLGDRQFTGVDVNGKFHYKEVVNAEGYLTGRIAPIGGTAPVVGIKGFGSGGGAFGLIKKESDFITLYRNFGKGEYSALIANDLKFTLQNGGNIGKDFWLTEEGLKGWNATGFSKAFNATIQADKKILEVISKESYFVDQLPNGAQKAISLTRADLETLNQYIKSIKIKKLK